MPLVQSSSAGSSGIYSAHGGSLSPVKIPAYNQLAASSLLNQQYAAALGLGKLNIFVSSKWTINPYP